ncbi:unnamed protein product, partial [Prorocentrum cordatum]
MAAEARPLARAAALSAGCALFVCVVGAVVGRRGRPGAARRAGPIVLDTSLNLNCSGPGETCALTGCCSRVGESCFMTRPGLIEDGTVVEKWEAMCMPKCVPGKGGPELCVKLSWPSQLGAANLKLQTKRSKLGDSMYCFSA